jgi:glycosyltransferase involved in cell wall biosynthesis
MIHSENAADLSVLARPDPGLVSIVIPLYNEEEVLGFLRERLEAVLPRVSSSVEIVLVNDGSTDGTAAQLQQWAAGDDRVRVVSLSRNFGHQPASTAGLDQA